MNDTIELNLDDLLGDIKPNYVTPELAKVTSVTNKNKPKVIADLIIRGMAASLKDPIQKDILHDGKIHTVRYVNVEPLCNGHWSTISLLLLSLSYGEQSTLIEALYPAGLQLYAKTFAVIFTPELQQTTVTLKQDDAIMTGLDTANAGIAMIISLIKNTGNVPHADEINKNKQQMAKLVETNKARDQYKKDITKAQDASKFQDGLRR